MKLGALFNKAGIEVPRGGSAEVSGVWCDSRQVTEGGVFVAVPGEQADGAAFAQDACRRGAIAVVGEHEPEGIDEVPYVQVADARLALANLCCAWRGNPSHSLSVAAITGTNGKSTVAHLLHQILSQCKGACALLGTVEYRWGDRRIPATRTTPDAVELQHMLAEIRDDGGDYVVMEASSHGLAQERLSGVRLTAAGFTNLTHDHLDYHGSMERYYRAKLKLFEQLRDSDGVAGVVNICDEWGQRLASWCRENDLDVVTVCGSVPSSCVTPDSAIAAADVHVRDVELGVSGSAFLLCSPWGDAQVKLPLLGRYNIDNAIMALALACVLGVEFEDCVRVLQTATGAPGRLERIETGRDLHVFVDYAHTSDALAKALQAMREVARRRVLVVFGCGGDRDRGKRPDMGRAAAEGADVVIVTSDNSRSEDTNKILGDIVTGVPDATPLYVEPDRRSAIRAAINMAEPGDLVLVAGKGHETVQVTNGRAVKFDDREEVRSALGNV